MHCLLRKCPPAEEKQVPSQLEDFTVYGKLDHIKVTWLTHARDKIIGFELQKSKDGKNFKTFSKIEDVGADPNAIEYFEVDNNPFQGWSYYRILQLIEKGNTAFSGVAPVFFGLDRIKRGEYIAATKPLDQVNSVNLEDFHDEQVLLVLRDAEGTEYYVNQRIQIKGGRLSVMAGQEIPQGIYVVTAASVDKLVGLEVFADPR